MPEHFKDVAPKTLNLDTEIESELDMDASDIYVFPASFAQQRLWVIDQLDSNNPVYNVHFAARFRGKLDVAALEESLREIIHRHETLRTTFEYDEAEEELLQVIVPALTLQIAHVNLEMFTDAEQERQLKQAAEEEIVTPFDLAQGPLLRAKLLRLASEEHVLLITMHHIISDGWSVGVLVQELVMCYLSYSKGQEPALLDLPIQYADYAQWQKDWLQGDVLDTQMSFWKKQLGGEIPVLQLPLDSPRPPVQTYRGSLESIMLSKELTDELKALSQRFGCTLFMTLLGAFQVLLHRYSGQNDISVGSPIAGRNRAELEGLIGFFVNTLVLRTDLSGDPTFVQLIERVREVTLGAFAHQEMPFEKLVKELKPERNQSLSPFFQVMFVLQNAPMGSIDLPELTIAPFEVRNNRTRFDLELVMEEQDGQLAVALNYNTDLFAADTMTRMIGHFENVLLAVVSNPELKLSQVSLLSEAEQHHLLVERNDTTAAFPLHLTIQELFAQQVTKYPDRLAVFDTHQALTYHELDQRSNQVAHGLRKRGIRPNQIVGIMLERGVPMIEAILGVLKAGAAYLPIDPAYPEERIRHMLEDSGAMVLLTDPKLAEKHQDAPQERIGLDDLLTEDSHAVEVTNTADDLAYVIYTSGSTGKPKGTMLRHVGVINLVQWKRSELGYSDQDTMLQFASFSFDAHVWEAFGALLNGAGLYILSGEERQSIEAFADAVDRIGATVATLPTVFFHQLGHYLSDEGVEKLKVMRLITVAGEALTGETVRAFQRRFGTCIEVVNAYGPTESTVGVTVNRVTHLVEEKQVQIPIGKPIGNTQIYILSESLLPCPVNVVGELYIGSVGLAKGYLNQPEKTAEVFLPHPFSQTPGERIYKTGDLARWLPDGTIEYVGRIDHQVKVRGYRIELGEIESALISHPEVSETLVMERQDTPGEKRIVAYVVTDSQGQLTSSELRSFLQTSLPDHMIPSAFVVLDTMPLTPNGKVDRRALPAPEQMQTARKRVYTAPRTEVEQALADVWASVLRTENVGIHDNFFELGGDSILSIQIIHRAAQQGVRLSPKDLFEYQTIAELAERAGKSDASYTAEQGVVTGSVLLTPIQHWFFEEEFVDAHHWNMPMLLELREAVNPEALQEVIAHLLAHHDALRLRFHRDATGWEQTIVEPDAEVPLTVIDLSDVPAAKQEDAFVEAATTWQASLNLSEGPLARFVYVEFGEVRPGRLLLVFHHLIVDGVSWRILLQDLELAYQQRIRGEEIQLPMKTTSFQEWAKRLADYAHSESVRQEQDYWLSAEAVASKSLPIDHLAGENTRGSSDQVVIALDQEQTQALLQKVPHVYNTQINDVLLTALALTFANWTGERTLSVTMEGHGREDILEGVDLSRTVGWFTSSYPVFLHLDAFDHVGQAIQQVKEQLRRIPSRGIGYGLLRYASNDLEVSTALGALPQPEVAFNYLGQFDQTMTSGTQFELSMAKSGPVFSERSKRTHLLEINGAVAGGQFQMNWLYSQQVHDRATIEALANSFLTTLQELIDHCLSTDAGGFTPSDFPQARLNQKQLDQFVNSISERSLPVSNIEQMYELSPAQQGMLFHSVLSPESGVYVVQLNLELRGNMNTSALQRAWQSIVDRHSILRTGFYWRGVDQPLQVVRRDVEAPLIELDWREYSEVQQAERLESYLVEDGKRGFQLSEAPLIRLTLIQMGEQVQRLVLSAHHLILDGWSMPLVFKELFAGYQAQLEDQQLALAPTRAYRDYIAWLQEQDEMAAQQYWTQRLAGFETPTVLGVKRTRASLESGELQYVEQHRLLSADVTSRLQALAREHQLTLNTLVQGAWSILLSRYSGEEDVVFGTTVSGRPADLEGVESMVGLFINTLPMRAKLKAESSILNNLHELQAQQLEMRQYEYTPLVKVQEWSDVSRDAQLFDTLFVFENYPMEESITDSFAGLAITDISSGEQTNYPLTVVVGPGKELSLKVMYDRMHFEDETVSRIMTHMLTLLENMAGNLEQNLSGVTMLSEPEKQQLLVQWNRTETPYPKTSIQQVFEEQAARTPDAVAVIFEDQQLTYRELNLRANQLAHRLQKCGVGSETFVGISTGRSLELIIGLLAIVKAGGVYVPIDPTYPADRITYMLEDSKVQVLVTLQKWVDTLPAHGAHVICLDAKTEAESIRQESEHNPLCVTMPDHLAYVVYTSGSTGKPKGVCVPHRGVVRLVKETDYVRFSEENVFLQFAPVAFDASTFEIWGSLLNGARLVVFPDVMPSLKELGRVLRQHQVTTLWLTTGLFNQMVEEHLEDLDSVRQLLTGGDVVSPLHAKKVLERMPNCRLFNCYGPTESTTFTTVYPMTDLLADGASVPIGKAIANTTTYVLDRNMQLVPVGVAGELYIGGDGLAQGYLNLPEMTQERFIPNPFATAPEQRLYKTGDLVRYLPDGNIEFLGRIDNQVKIRGFRIELGEIEAELSRHPAVQDAVVLVREDVPGDKRLVAYLWVEKGELADSREVRTYLKERLPDYMIPTAYVAMDEFPLNANGKIDRRALPAPDYGQFASDRVYQAPCNPIEEQIATIWSDVLRVDKIGRQDHFFDLGGHSLLATQAVSRLNDAFQVEIPLRMLFAHATVEALAVQIERLQQGEQGLQTVSISKASRAEHLSLSFAQQRLWVVDRLLPGTSLYNMPYAVRLQGALHQEALERSINEILCRHETLRTTFVEMGGQAVQVIAQPAWLQLEVVDLQGLSADQREVETKQRLQAEADQPFDLTVGPLIRVSLLQFDEQEHVLLMNMHHIVSDGWSMGVFIREMASLYEAYASGEESPLDELSIQYADYAVWQREWLQGDVLESQLSYWKQQLGGEQSILQVPTDRPRPAMQTHVGAMEHFVLSREVADALQSLSQREGVTLFMTLLAAFQTLLSRYSGQENISVGTPIAGRHVLETEALIGFFVNTLVMRTDLSGDPTFAELLGRVREVALGAYSNQDVPFEKLVEEVQPERDLSRSPLFQVMFALQNAPMSALELTGLTLEHVEIESHIAKFDLTLFMTEGEAGIRGSLEYNTDLYEAATIRRMIEQFETLLVAIAADAGQRVSELPLLCEGERHRLLVEWNETSTAYPQMGIHQLFVEQAERTPDTVAVVFGERKMTYRELDRRSNQLAHLLQKQGVTVGRFVGLSVERSVEMIVGLVAILKAGGVYVPIDPTYPIERISYFLEDSQVSVLLTKQQWLDKVSDQQVQVICFDTDEERIDQESQEQVISEATIDSLAYVVYTSGSTGKPKGVVVPHRGVVRLVKETDYVQFSAKDVFLQFAPVAFDASTFEIWGSLLNGARLVVFPPEMPSLEELGRVIHQQQVTMLWLTTGLFNQMVDEHLDDLSSVRQLLTGGDVISAMHVKKVLERLPNCQLINCYGPTENTTFTTTYPVTGMLPDGASVPIGKAIANTTTYVLDQNMQPVPVGVAGELYIGGDALAQGYLNLPEMTEKSFLPNPFATSSGQRLYKTGDLVRYLPDGNIDFLGRIDNQVKIRGFRIELGEIEAALSQHSAVQEAVVIARADASGNKRLIAYLVADPSAELESGALRGFLKAQLPDYMVPSAFVTLDVLPLNANGKVDRKALPEPEFTHVGNEEIYRAPRTPVEEIVAGILGDVLGVQQVGIYDNFFELGGHSLLATQVISRINSTFALEVPLRVLFEAPTVAGLVGRMEDMKHAQSGLEVVPILPTSREGNHVLSFAQQRLWVIDQMLPGSTVYNMPYALRLQGDLKIQAVEQSLNAILQRHEALRTTFVADAGQPQQVIAESLWLPLSVENLQHCPESEREVEALRLTQEALDQPFDLSNGPLIRFCLLQLAEQDYILILNMHHIVSDGWSMGVFIKEFAALYAEYVGGPSATLPFLDVQYADYAEWQQQLWLTGGMDEQLTYWKQQLSGHLPVLQLPTDRPRPAVQTFQGAVHKLHLSASLTEQLHALSQREGATLFMTLLSAYKTLLYRYTGQEDLLVGTPIAGRNHREIEELIGFFINTLVLRTQLSGEFTFQHLLQRVREVSLEAYAHQDLPFDKLVGELEIERQSSYSPLFQVLFVLQNMPFGTMELPNVTLELLDVARDTAKFDLTLSVIELDSGMQVEVEYNTDLFDAATIERFVGHYQMLLESIVANPAQTLAQLPILTGEEREQLLNVWPSNICEIVTEPDALSDYACIHHAFEKQAERTPDALAVQFEEQYLTYRELNERANQLAHHLQKRGVGPEVLVGLWFERSLDMVVSILAVLKAGGAYVPLDPMYPAERIAFVLDDAKAPVLLTQQHLVAQLSEGQAEVICLDAEWERIAEESVVTPHSDVNGDSVAYVIYTSGSTGKPKGVLIPHSNVMRLFTATNDWYHFHSEDVWTLFHSYAFDFSVWEIWGALLYGGKLVVVPYWISREPEAFYNLLHREGVTVLNQTPSAFRQLIQAEERLGVSDQLALRYVIFGGEALELNSLTPWFERHGDQQPQLINMYGITETTVHVTYRPITRADVQAGAGSVIGVPIPDLQVYVLDSQLQPVPIGVPGELYVGGAGLAHGYLNRSELTAERFIEHPFAEQGEAKLYKTGDLVRFLAQGELEYLGRIDQQVKVRGFRIELGEIQSVLVKHPSVRDAVVMVREDRPGDKRLVGYVLLAEQTELSADELRRSLSEQLPEYMVPSAFVFLESLPLTGNGKVDYRALPAPEQARTVQEGEYVAPTNAVETRLAEIWAQVLDLERISVTSTFFELGGDSILSIQVLSHAREQGLSFTVQDLFRHQTIRALAPFVQTDGKIQPIVLQSQPFSLISEADRALLPQGVDDAYPLSSLQAGMLFHSQLAPESSVYHNTNSTYLRAPFDQLAMEAAFAQLVKRHPVLRTSFHMTGYSEPLQVVHSDVRIPFDVYDLRGRSLEEQEQIIAAYMEKEQKAYFDWTQAPLLRVYVHRRTDDTFQFGFTEHHAILDGWSVATMNSEFFQIYLALFKEGAYQQEELDPGLFREFIALERDALASEQCQLYWQEQLSEFTFTQLPSQNTTQHVLEPDIHGYPVQISEALSHGLKQLVEHLNAPLKSILLAAHLRAISVASGQNDVLTGVVSNGRPEVEGGEKVIGLFLNTLPFRAKLTGGTWADLVRETFAAEQEVMSYRRYPMAQIQQDVGSRTLFEVSFNYTHFHVYQSMLEEIEVLESGGYGFTNFALDAEFSLDVVTSQVQLSLTYDANRFSDEQIERVAGYYLRVLDAMANAPHSRYEEHSVFGAEEQQWLLVERNQTTTTDPLDVCLHQLFEAQVARTPDATAVVLGEETLTYQQLNERANQVAHYLQKKEVGPDVLVGICIERSLNMVVAALGVLKAGGAYVPIDPTYPSERIAYVLADSSPQVLLTQESLVAQLPPHQAQTICLDADWEDIVGESTASVPNTVTEDHLAYLIYTSGSTGRPKGAMITHRGLTNYLTWGIEAYRVEAGQGALVHSSFAFDLTVTGLYLPLLVGKQVVLLPDQADVEMLANTLRRYENFSLVKITPAHLQLLAEQIPESELAGRTNALIIGGEALTYENIARWQQFAPDTILINEYGPTETVVGCVIYQVPSGARPEGAVPIGRPIANTQIYILDAFLQPVPIGAVGEMYIGGAGVCRGYWKRPDLTAERFIPNPFQSEEESRLYKTGDLARYLPDGNIEYVGRIDDQVKIRGFRIELGEIEALIASHPAVREVAVVAREDVPGDKRIVAYLVEQLDAGLDVNGLHHELRTKLPDYMMPSAIVRIDELPLTSNGKVDRRALPAPQAIMVEHNESYLAPRDSVEAELVRIWEEVLHVQRVGVKDDFFRLGGHSLLAIRLMARITQQFKRDLPLSALFEGVTIEQMAGLLRQSASEPTYQSLVRIQKGSADKTPLFLVHPVGGNVLSYYELARALGSEQPIYGLQAQGLATGSEPLTEIEAMAGHYVTEMQSVQPEGPYRIGGWSFGGVVAFEMAQQLQRQGHQVELLALFDSQAPIDTHRNAETISEEYVLRLVVAEVAGAIGLNTELDQLFEGIGKRTADEVLQELVAQAQAADVWPPGMEWSSLRQMYSVYKANLQANYHYTPNGHYTDSVVLFRAADEQSVAHERLEMGWSQWIIDRLTVVEVPGTHYSIWQAPHIQYLAEQLLLRLKQLDVADEEVVGTR